MWSIGSCANGSHVGATSMVAIVVVLIPLFVVGSRSASPRPDNEERGTHSNAL